MSAVAVSLDIEKAFGTMWNSGLLCKLYELKFSTNLMKFISSYLSERRRRNVRA
jgi:hypothetical protein